MEKVKKRITFQKVLSMITDILIYPVIVLAVLSSFVMLNSKRDNEVYSVFGISVVKVLSGSMVASGFEKDDLVILKRTKTDDLREGDNIAFYRFKDNDDPITNLVKIQDFENLPEITSQERVVGTKTKRDAAKAQSPVIFHQIIAIYQAADGTRFFQTQGTSNQSADNTLIKEDYVVGKDIGTPEWLNKALQFCSSSKGMIVLVIVPLSILIFFQLLEIFELINQLLLEKKVLALEVRYDFQDCYKNNIGFEMRYFDQIYFYDVVPVKDKKPVQDFLWANLYSSTKRREIKRFEIINQALNLYPEDTEKYWQYVIKNEKSQRNRKKMEKSYVLAKSIKRGQEKNNAFENYEQLKYTTEFINALENKRKAEEKQKEKQNKKSKQKIVFKTNETEQKLEQQPIDQQTNQVVEVKHENVSPVKQEQVKTSVVNKSEKTKILPDKQQDKKSQDKTESKPVKPEGKLVKSEIKPDKPVKPDKKSIENKSQTSLPNKPDKKKTLPEKLPQRPDKKLPDKPENQKKLPKKPE